ncbi:MAG: peptide ABC transporter substrate-binding protein [Rhodospirillaceae bacterium]|jgi:peptide/nickel transport system substrate-binding protein|nr:peptide ABC transporter substrate-binding protein [Rhodospirillaceae bacterium]
MRTIFTTLILAICLVIAPLSGETELAAAQSGGPLSDPAPSDTLTIGITQFPSTFHPNIDSMMAKSYVLAMTMRPFTVFDAQWKLVCMLCIKLPTLENGMAVRETTQQGKEGIAVTYTIRKNARWGDGIPVTSMDVIFTWEAGRHPLSGVANAELYRRILKIDAIDEKTFTLHFDRVSFDYNAINDFGLLPAHLERQSFTVPAEYRNRTLYDTDTTNPGLYFGPYRIEEVVTGSHIVLAANETWWGEPPHFKKIIVYVIENTAAIEANLLSGAIDMIAGELGLTLDQALSFEKRHGAEFNVIFKPGLVYEHIDLNLDNPLLADRNLRQALLYGIDRVAISEQLFAGKQPVAQGPVSPLDWVYDSNIASYPYDPEKASALFDAAGWIKGEDGLRRNADGKHFSLTLMTTSGDHTRALVEQVIQSQWHQLGIKVNIRNQPARVFFGQTVTQRKFTGGAMFAWISSPENIPRSTLHSMEIPNAENNYAGQNYTGYANDEADALIDAIEVELDRQKRRELWARLQTIYARDLPALPLYYRAQPFVLPQWLKGVVPTGHQYPSTLWVENWKVSP